MTFRTERFLGGLLCLLLCVTLLGTASASGTIITGDTNQLSGNVNITTDTGMGTIITPNPQPTAPHTGYPIWPDGGQQGNTQSGGTAYVYNPIPTQRLNLREKPDANSRSLDKYANGVMVSVLGWYGDWCHVHVGGKYGYMLSQFLTFNGPPPVQPILPIGKVTHAVVNNPIVTQRLNLRERASVDSYSLGKYYNGTYVSVITYGPVWCYVEVNGLRGYMMTMYLSFDGGSQGGTQPAPVGRTYAAVVQNPIATQKLNLRAQPNSMSKSLGLYSNGTAVSVLGVGTDWCRVRIAGIEGYVMTRFIHITSSGASANTSVSHPDRTFVNLRTGAGTQYNVIQRVPHGTAVTVITPLPEWSEVMVREGTGYRTGYMMNSFLKSYQ